jgi:hypothetical protein
MTWPPTFTVLVSNDGDEGMVREQAIARAQNLARRFADFPRGNGRREDRLAAARGARGEQLRGPGGAIGRGWPAAARPRDCSREEKAAAQKRAGNRQERGRLEERTASLRTAHARHRAHDQRGKAKAPAN